MLAHERCGSGPPLILIHGLGSRRQVWAPLITELARHREVIAIDLPGFGESPLWPPPAGPRTPHGPTAPDTATPDTAAPGLATPDTATPGVATPDTATPGVATPDTATPGVATPGGRRRSGGATSGRKAADDRTASGRTPPSDTAFPGARAVSDPASPEGAAAFGDPPAPHGFVAAGDPTARTNSWAADDSRTAFGGPPVPGSVGHLADLVAAFLDELGLDRPELAGSSLGGGIALELGRRGRASAVTAFAPVGFWGPAGRRWCQTVVGGARVLSAALAPALPRIFATRAGRAALCGIFYGRPARLSPEDCLGSARALAHAPGFAAARRAFSVRRLPVGADPGALAGIPVTIAWGTRDLVLPHRRQAARARAELPAARHVLLPGCGHLPFADDPARCVELLTARQ